MTNHATICIAVRSEGKPFDEDATFARRLNASIDKFMRTREKTGIVARHRDGMFGWVLGADTAEGQQVYVLQEGTGERVSATEGSKASVDALVNVLRARGYTCIKRSDPE